jgi:hypothetical protein
VFVDDDDVSKEKLPVDWFTRHIYYDTKGIQYRRPSSRSAVKLVEETRIPDHASNLLISVEIDFSKSIQAVSSSFSDTSFALPP